MCAVAFVALAGGLLFIEDYTLYRHVKLIRPCLCRRMKSWREAQLYIYIHTIFLGSNYISHAKGFGRTEEEKGQKDSPSIIHSMACLVISALILEYYNLFGLRWNVAESLGAKKESPF